MKNIFKKDKEALILAQTALQTISQLIECVAENQTANKDNFISAMGETEIEGVMYQIQISLIPDKNIWVEEDEISRSRVEVV